MNWIAPWHVVHSCPQCQAGWICEAHPDRGWPHDDCAGPGMPCQGLLDEMAQWEAEARAVLGPPELDDLDHA